MKPYHWVLLSALLIASCIALGYQIKNWEDRGDRLEMEQVVSRQTVAFDALLEASRIEDSLRRVEAQGVLRGQEQETEAAEAKVRGAKATLDTIRQWARNANDSLAMVPALEQVIAHKEDQIQGLLSQRRTLSDQVQEEIRATAGLRVELVEWKRGVDTVWTPTVAPKGNKPGKIAETLAMGLVTASACRNVSVGCVVGLVVVGLRVR